MADEEQARLSPGQADLDKPTCGIVMPISPTAQHDGDHWRSVLALIKRAIEQAGLTPATVWAGSAADRITTRILHNLFKVPILVCDISDLNANVMLELGMRLSSKKPTVVVCEEGSVIPFDIKDFEAISYPKHLSMIQMENFLKHLTEQLAEKYAAFNQGTYQPFLAEIETFEVLEPKAREVPFEKLVVDQLEAILSRVERLENTNNFRSTGIPRSQYARPISSVKRLYRYSIPIDQEWEIKSQVEKWLPDEPNFRTLAQGNNRAIIEIEHENVPGNEASMAHLAQKIAERGGVVVSVMQDIGEALRIAAEP